MKRLILLMAVIAISMAAVQAQNGISPKKTTFSIGVEPALPVGDFGDFYSFGIGGSLQVEHKVADDLGITLNAGYINYSGKDYRIGSTEIDGGNIGIVPVLAGVKYYFTPKVYGHAQLGAGIWTEKGASTAFAYSPGIGYYFSEHFDILLKYVGYSQKGSNSNSIGARLAYNF